MGFSVCSAEDLVERCLSMPTKAFGMDSMAGDPHSMATQRWAAITNSQADLAGELAAVLVVPEVTNTFTFDDDDEQISDGVGGAYDFPGTDADTVVQTLTYWNLAKEVGLIFVQAGDGYCLASMSSGGKEDFGACAQFTPGPGVTKSKEYTYTKHLSPAPRPCPWFVVKDDGRGSSPSQVMCITTDTKKRDAGPIRG